MSRSAELKKRYTLLSKLIDPAIITDGEDLATLMEMILEISTEMTTYHYECAKCGSLKLSEVTYQTGVPPFNIWKCNRCGDVVKLQSW